MNTHVRRVLVALAVAAPLVAGLYVVRAWGSREPGDSHPLVEPAPSTPVPEALADWCTAGYEPVPGGCLAVPSRAQAPLLIYLHGRYPSDQAAEEMDRQRRVAARFTRNGYAVLALRGRLGGCGAAELSTWYCWPSNERTIGTAGDVVAGWRGALDAAENRVHPERRFVLGFSNGGYFAVLLASRGLLQADAYVIAHAGPVDPVGAERGTPPVLLLSADDDVAQEDMLRLDAELTKGRWPHDSYARAGVHGLTDQDVDATLAFIGRSAEPLPLDPALAGLHRPSHHPHDAGVSAPATSDEASLPSDEDEPVSSE